MFLLHAGRPSEEFEQTSGMAWLLKRESAALLRWTVVGQRVSTGKWVGEEEEAASRETVICWEQGANGGGQEKWFDSGCF